MVKGSQRDSRKGEKYWYDGSLSSTECLDPDVKRAHNIWKNQRDRCRNKKNKKYPYYGAKGVQVKYRSREFIGWWLENLKNFKGDNPTTSRLDHNGHYEFKNIKMESFLENCCFDVIRRHGTPTKPKKIAILCAKSKRLVAIAESSAEAQRITGVSRGNICDIARNRNSWSGKGYTFRFIDHRKAG